jgi:hypothetical protein
VPPDIFSQFRSQAPGSGETTIPVFRFKKILRSGRSDSSYKKFLESGADNKAQRELDVDYTVEQFNQETAGAQFARLLMDKNLLEKWQELVVKAGILSATEATDAIKLEAAWKQAVGWAINMKAATNGKTEMTPFEALEAVAQNTGAAALAAQQYAQEHFTGTKVMTSKTVDKSFGAQEGEALRQLLGRNPTESELAAYKRGLADVAERNPTVTRQATTYQEGEAVGIDQTVSGGYDSSAAAFASASEATPEVAMNQQATTYYDALIRAIGPAV